MVDFRANPPKDICGSPIVAIKDYQALTILNPASGETSPLESDKSNVLQYLTADGTILSIRPSGTEPKIKFYFGVKEPLASLADYDTVSASLDAKIEQMKKELNLVSAPVNRIHKRNSRVTKTLPESFFFAVSY